MPSPDTKLYLIPTVITASLGLVVYYFHRPVPNKIPIDDETHKKISASDILRLIQNRRSIFPKQYTGHPVPAYMISDMLEAAR